MQKNNKVLVFDTKYKRMNFEGKSNFGLGDVDRCDFFQINTYMSYYKNQKFNVIAGGLLYPLESPYDEKKCFSNNWFGDEKTKFIIDGIGLNELKEKKENKEQKYKYIKQQEDKFIKRIEKLINDTI